MTNPESWVGTELRAASVQPELVRGDAVSATTGREPPWACAYAGASLLHAYLDRGRVSCSVVACLGGPREADHFCHRPVHSARLVVDICLKATGGGFTSSAPKWVVVSTWWWTGFA